VLFLVEHNGWAQSTDTSRTTTGDVLQRAQGFGVTASRVSDTDPEALSRHLSQVVATVRTGQPHLVVVDTRRLMAHSKGDDDRPKELVERLWREDPIARLLDDSAAARQRARGLESDVRVLATSVAQRPYLADLDRDPLPPNRKTSVSTSLHAELHAELLGGTGSGRIAEELNSALHTMMAGSAEVVVVGEDLLDPYGGAFKVTRGLSTAFPGRVLSTPISEAAIVGAANGMALAGMRPVVEIMFADFVTLAADQLINFAAKFHAMYAGRVRCPLTVRLVSGGGRGYGPTHSQSLETLFCGVPGLRVVALSQRHRPQALLTEVVLDDDGPVVFVEGKSLYPLRPHAKPPLDLRVVPATGSGGNLAPLRYAPAGNRRPEVTVVTYGASTAIAEAAMRGLIESEETIFEYVVLTQLWPLDVRTIVESVARTGRLVVVEENTAAFGVAAAVIAEVAQRHGGPLACRAVGAEPVPIPSARHLEDLVLPSPAAVGAAIREIL
jgi:2-oxoisovalerate dehydrogenase E1 component